MEKRQLRSHVLLRLGLCVTLCKSFNSFPFCMTVFVVLWTENWSKKVYVGGVVLEKTALRSGNRYGKTEIRAEGIFLSCISM